MVNARKINRRTVRVGSSARRSTNRDDSSGDEIPQAPQFVASSIESPDSVFYHIISQTETIQVIQSSLKLLMEITMTIGVLQRR